MRKMTITIGYGSSDGHSMKEDCTILCSHTKKDLEEAYFKSCKLTGLQFHTNGNATGLDIDWQSGLEDRKILNNYQDSKLNNLVRGILNNHGIEVLEDYEWEVEESLKLLLNFVKLSLPELKWKILEKTEEEKEFFDFNWCYGIFKD